MFSSKKKVKLFVFSLLVKRWLAAALVAERFLKWCMKHHYFYGGSEIRKRVFKALATRNAKIMAPAISYEISSVNAVPRHLRRWNGYSQPGRYKHALM